LEEETGVAMGAVRSKEIPEVRNICMPALIRPIPVSVRFVVAEGRGAIGSPAMKFLISISPSNVQSPERGQERERGREREVKRDR
jgi:hypothetical protein